MLQWIANLFRTTPPVEEKVLATFTHQPENERMLRAQVIKVTSTEPRFVTHRHIELSVYFDDLDEWGTIAIFPIEAGEGFAELLNDAVKFNANWLFDKL